MRVFHVFLCLLIFSLGCQQKTDVKAEIASLEAQLTSNPAEETLVKLEVS